MCAPSPARASRRPRGCSISVEQTVRQTIPPDQLDNIVDNIGLPFSGINMAYQNTGTIGPEDGDALISLKRGSRADGVLRQAAAHDLAADNFRARPSRSCRPISSRRSSISACRRRSTCRSSATISRPITPMPPIFSSASARFPASPICASSRCSTIRRSTSMSIGRSPDEVGLTQRDVANSLLVTLSGSAQVNPNFWLNTENGVSYPIVAQMPQYRIDTMSDLVNVPMTSAETQAPQYLGGLAQITPGPSPGVVSHYNVQPVIDILRRHPRPRSRRSRRRHRSHPAARPAKPCRAAPTSCCAARSTR